MSGVWEMARGVGAGIAMGLAWGLVARAFMRLLSTDPEFSWSGTLGILALAAVAGGGVGLVRAARRAGRSRWWRLSVVPGLLLFFGQGLLLVPSAVGLALVLRGGPRTRIVGSLLAVVTPVLTVALLTGDGPAAPLTGTQWAGVALLVLSVVPLGWGLGEVARRWPARAVAEASPAPGPLAALAR